MIEESFMIYYKRIVDKIYKLFDKRKNVSSWLIKNFIERINNQVVNLELDKDVFSNLIFDLYKKIPSVKTELVDKRIDESQIIRLPILKKKHEFRIFKKNQY